ncbi:Ig-like domain-containing protein [Symbioplanes lichenis]|uniref:Ig-like domain-containing protein n=1 Tax=Symbioplanes lichenis TaxID=1629072 RepID=UPI002739C0FE|nr:Ig-like domain-containing protein [Actinoplanes lichenis]
MQRRRTRRSPDRELALYVIVLLLAGMALVFSPDAKADVTTAFGMRFGTNTNGGILLRGNTLLTCDTTASGCTAAQNGSNGTTTNNDNFEMRYVDIDGDAGTFNSSSSTLTLASGSSVLWAGLYWSGDTESATNTNNGAVPIPTPSVADKDKVKFKVPGGAYADITASRVDSATITGREFYQGFADVTSRVAAAGSGVYTVANVQATQNDSRYAGWALVIAYRNPAEPVRNLSIFDGFGYINSSGTPATPSVDITVSGFQTPPTGTVKSKIGTVAYEGDLGITGDALKLDGVTLSDAANPANNYFNSSVSDDGVRDTARNPNFSNLMAVDIDQVTTTTALGNGKTSATLNLSTSQDTFYPGVVTMATDLFAPDIDAVVTPTDLNGGSVKPGDVIEYTVTVKNEGNDGATDLLVSDAIPAGTVYVPGSLQVDGSARTDASGDDQADFSAGTATFRLGSGATASAGGALPIGSTTVIKYQVRVDPDTPGGYVITNVANMSAKGASSNPPLTVNQASNISTITVTAAATDLAVTGSVTPARVQKDGTPDPVGYDLTVVNNGPDAQLNSVLTLTLPAGVTPSSGGACAVSGQVVTCALGTIATGATVTTHIDATAGNSAADPSTATATVTGKYADSVPASNTASIALAVNRAPVAGADTGSTTNGVAVTRTVLSNDSDPDGDALHVQSVNTPAHGGAVVNGDNTITYTPNLGFKGVETITYTVADPRGGTATGTLTVTVANAGPTAVADSTGTAARTAATINVLANDTDPNGDTLSVTSITQPSGGAATGTVVNNGNGTLTFTPSTSFGGSTSFTYTISDGDGGTSVGTVTVTVANQAPTAVNDNATTPYLTNVTVPVRTNDTDPNNDPLSITGITVPRDSGGTQRGTASTDGSTITYVPPATFSGVVTLSYTISDGKGGTSTATLTVTVANAPPVAVADTATTPYHQAVTVDARANDTDANNDTLTVTSAGPAGHGVVTSQPDGTLRYAPDQGFSGTDTFSYTVGDGRGGTATSTVTVTVGNAVPVATGDARTIEAGHAVTVPVLLNDTDENPDDVLSVTAFDAVSAQGGTVVRSGTQLVYTPPFTFLGVDTFTYTAGDGHGGSALATVTITVQNTPPVAGADAATTPTDTAVDIPVLANDSDAGNDPLTVTAVTGGAHGVVSTDGLTVTYTPDAGFHGTDTATYTVTDGRGGYDSAVINITVLNAPPVAVPDAVRAQPQTATRVTVLANDTDANHDQLVVINVTAGAHGTVTVTADGDAVVYTSAAGFHGTDTFAYTVSDGNGGTANGVVTVTVNAAPVATDDGPRSTPTNQSVTIDVLANDTDAENDTLTVSAGAPPAHGSIAVNPDGTIVYAPATGYSGPDSFTYTVTDPAGGTSSATVDVTVANAAPVAAPDNGYSTKPGGSVDVSVLLNDTDANVGAGGQTLRVVSVTRPAHGTAEITAPGVVTYKAGTWKGADTFTYTVSDGHGGTDTAVVTVLVDNDVPQASGDSASAAAGTPVTIDVLGNDTDPNGDALVVKTVYPPLDSSGATRGTVTTDGKTVVYTPPAGFRGTVSFGYTVVDPDGQPSTALVTVDVANAAPVAVPDAAGTPYLKPVTVDALRNDTDPNGDKLTIVSRTQPAHGTVSAGFMYTPEAGFDGKDTFTYTISDGFGGTATTTVTITVAPAPAVPDKAVKSGPGEPVDVMMPAKDQGGRPVELISVTQPAHGTVVLNDDGTVTYTPKPGFTGRDSFEYVVRDKDGNEARGSIDVRVPAAPQAGDDAVQIPRSTKTTVDVLDKATDADGDKLILKSVSRPRHGTVKVNKDGTVTYTPVDDYVGADSFTYTVVDADGNASTGTITISVTGTDDPDDAVSLPLTGADVMTLAGGGLLVVLAGAALVALGVAGSRHPAVAKVIGRHRRVQRGRRRA